MAADRERTPHINVGDNRYIPGDNLELAVHDSRLNLEDLSDDEEVVLFTIPADVNVKDLVGKKFDLESETTFTHTGEEGEETTYACTLTELPEDKRLLLVVPSKDEELFVASKVPIAGQINFKAVLDVPEPFLKHKKHPYRPNLASLKQRFIPFGGEVAIEAPVTKSPKKHKKRNRERVDEVDNGSTQPQDARKSKSKKNLPASDVDMGPEIANSVSSPTKKSRKGKHRVEEINLNAEHRNGDETKEKSTKLSERENECDMQSPKRKKKKMREEDVPVEYPREIQIKEEGLSENEISAKAKKHKKKKKCSEEDVLDEFAGEKQIKEEVFNENENSTKSKKHKKKKKYSEEDVLNELPGELQIKEERFSENEISTKSKKHKKKKECSEEDVLNELPEELQINEERFSENEINTKSKKHKKKKKCSEEDVTAEFPGDTQIKEEIPSENERFAVDTPKRKKHKDKEGGRSSKKYKNCEDESHEQIKMELIDNDESPKKKKKKKHDRDA